MLKKYTIYLAVLTNLTNVVGRVPEEVLVHLAMQIPKEYEILAVKLSIDSATLDAINEDNKGNVRITAFKALVAWDRRNPYYSMCDKFYTLEKELCEIGRNDLAEYIYAG